MLRYCFRYGLEQIIFTGWWTLTQFIQELSFPITIFRSLSIYYHSSKRVLSTLTLVKEPLHFLWFLRLEQQLAHGILEVVGSQRTRNNCFHHNDLAMPDADTEQQQPAGNQFLWFTGPWWSMWSPEEELTSASQTFACLN